MQDQTAAIAELAHTDQSAAELRARASYYQLLAGAFIEEPGTDYLRAIRTPEAVAALAELGVLFDEDVTQTSLAELQEALAYEYATLFASPGGCPPVESARLAGRFQQEPYHAVKAIYQRAGFVLQQGKFTVFEDQLGIELSFVAALLERQAAQLDAGDMTACAKIEKDIKRFWALHLGRWARGYASLLERATEHSFYREIARLLAAFAEDELALLQVHVEDADGGREVVPKAEVSVLFNADEPVCNGCEHSGSRAVA
ncbi:TorD/DmsD family molecular chaperone [Noviherbaspirillum sp. ST9]|uniref:TorD/DmsD family molecular chaperone n=1 Tax=Noviherbaspirillum sp. ST9 TaxID=3401606 RepID=UPI003B587F3E